MTIGIIGAMSIEVDALKDMMTDREDREISSVKFCRGILNGVNVIVAEAGVGKVNAAVTAEAMILTFRPDYIINTGVAGGLDEHLKIGDIVIADKVCEHDMDTTPIGDPPGYITGLNKVYMKCDPYIGSELMKAAEAEKSINVDFGIVASGDQFIATDEQRDYIRKNFSASAAEMEGAAIGHVCAQNNIAFAVIRAISDSANDDSKVDFPVFAAGAAKRSVSILSRALESIAEKGEV